MKNPSVPSNLEPDNLEMLHAQTLDPEIQLESRRNFLKLSGAALVLLATASVGFADDEGNEGDDDGNQGNMGKAIAKGQVDVGATSSFKPGSMTDKTSVAGVMISRTAQGLIALAPVCTHQGCDTHFSGAAAQHICPCHGARFSNDGAVTAGPARAPLSRYAISLKNGRVIVDTNKLIQRSAVKASDFVKV
jgi:cytochrome b6-f complex iron-sulfur subunit